MHFYAQKICLSKSMIHEYSNYANKMICISDHEMKACVKAPFGTNLSSLWYVAAAVSSIL